MHWAVPESCPIEVALGTVPGTAAAPAVTPGLNQASLAYLLILAAALTSAFAWAADGRRRPTFRAAFDDLLRRFRAIDDVLGAFPFRQDGSARKIRNIRIRTPRTNRHVEKHVPKRSINNSLYFPSYEESHASRF